MKDKDLLLQQSKKISEENRNISSNRRSYSSSRTPREQVKKRAKSRASTAIRTNPQPRENKLRIIPFGGLGEIGRNMMALEWEDDCIIVDMGLQFPEEDMPGIDYVIPNPNYFRGREDTIRGVIITHGHLDHIGAIPHLIQRIGNPTIYGTALSIKMIEKKQEDFRKERFHLNTQIVDPLKDKLKLGVFEIDFFRVNHNIPDGMGLIIHTPVGVVMHTGDFKFDLTPVGDPPANFEKIAETGRNGVLLLCSDSTGSTKKGHQISERQIMKTLETIIRDAPGRIITATFSTLITRIQQVVMLAYKYNKKVLIEGYSMRTNTEICRKLGYLYEGKGTIISRKQAYEVPNENLIVMCTGAQGEDNAVMMRMVNKEHDFLKVEKNDTVVFSSSVIPGNERSVQTVHDLLAKQGARIVNYQQMDVHSSGHAASEDLKLMLKLVNPKYLLPIHGNYYFLREHAELAKEMGMPDTNALLIENGQVLEFEKTKDDTIGKISPEVVQTDYVFVDGLGVGDIGNIVLRDRRVMAEDGMVVIIVKVKHETARLSEDPDIISRGFIYMKGSEKLLTLTKNRVREILEHTARPPINWSYVRNSIRDDIGEFLYQKTERRPMILPVVMEV